MSGSAIASLVLGILSWAGCGFVAGIPAIITGHTSLSTLKRNPFLTGRELAIAGLIAGYSGTVISFIGLAYILLRGTTSIAPFTYNL